MNFNIQKGIFMLNDKTQDCFLNNLIGCFYKNYLILNAKTLNSDFVLDVIDLSIDQKNFLKGPKKSRIKVGIRDLPKDYSDFNRLKDILHDVKTLYIKFGLDHDLITESSQLSAYKSQDFQLLNSDSATKLSAADVWMFYMRLLPMVQHMELGGCNPEHSNTINPFRYAFSLDKFICDFPEDLSFEKSKALVFELVKNNWRKWANLNKFTNETTYDAVLINSDYLVIAKVNVTDVSIELIELDSLEGLVSALVCDLEVLKCILKHRFEQVGCSIGSYRNLAIEYNPKNHTTFLTGNFIKAIPYIPNTTIEKYLKKALNFADGIKIEAIEPSTKGHIPQNLIFSSSLGLPYIQLCEHKIKKSFCDVMNILAEKGVSIEQLRIVNILSKYLVERELSLWYLNIYTDNNFNQNLENILLNITNETNVSGSGLNENILKAITDFENNHNVTAKLVFKRNADLILIYEPSNPDHRLVRYEWFSEARYSNSKVFEAHKIDIHKKFIKDSLEDVQILHSFSNDFLAWNMIPTFNTPLEKKMAFDICLTEDMIKTESSKLVEFCETPDYLDNLITSLSETSSINSDHPIYGFFLPFKLQTSDPGYTYEGVFLEIDEQNKIDLSSSSFKTLKGESLPKNYLTFKRLISL